MHNIEGFLDEQHEIAREIAENSIVLLKNDDSILPLPLTSKTRRDINILFVGESAKNPHFQGQGSAHIEQYKIDNCYDCSIELIKLHYHDNSTGKVNLSYVDGFDTIKGKTTNEMKAEAIKASFKADVVVIFAGTPISQENENNDLTSLSFPSDENELIRDISTINKNVVIVLQNGSCVEMPWKKDVKGILETYFSGEAGGKATANILFGLVNPSGHLNETFPIKVSDNQTFYNFPGHGDKVEYSEGLFVGYRYYDTYNINVLFPFGFGLSYTIFEYSNIRLRDVESEFRKPLHFDFYDIDPNIFVLVDVKNTGNMAGKTVAQLYVSDQTNAVVRPVKELKGFKKVHLEPGETKTIEFHLNQRSFAFWNTDIHDWSVASGNYYILISQYSRDYNSQLLDIKIKSSIEDFSRILKESSESSRKKRF